MAKKKQYKKQNITQNKVRKEMHFVAAAPRRQNFDIQHWRTAIKQAENVQFPNRAPLYDIYHDIIIDAHLTSVIEQRENALFKDPIVFSLKGKEHTAINDLIELPWFEDFVLEIWRSKLWGYSLLWTDIAGAQFNDFESLDRKHIIPKKHLFVKHQHDRDGIDFLQPPYSYYTVPVGTKNDLGLLLKAVPWVLLKRGDISDWASFNEIFANPIRKGSYPLYNDDAKKELMEGLRDMGAFGTVIHPKDTDLEFLITNAAGSADAYNKLANICDMYLSKLLVGQTMTTDNGSSRSQADVHLEIAKQYTARDRRYVLNILNTKFLELLEMHGFNPAGGKFQYKTETDIKKLQDRFNIDKELSNKIEYPPEYFYDTYGVPIPKGGAAFKNAVKDNKPDKTEKQQNKADTEDVPTGFDRLKRFFA